MLLCVAFAAMSASAQITWNVKGGVGYAHLLGDTEGLKGHVVGKAGVGIEKPFTSNWSLMPSLEVALKGCKIEDYKSMNLLYVQVPVLAAYRLNINDSWNTTLKAGPYFGVGVYGTENAFSDLGCKRFECGLVLGVDFEYHRFVFGVEYELGFTNLVEEDGASARNAAFYATVGYKF